MSFIYRDYAGPMVAAGNHVIKMKKLFNKIAPTEYLDGIHVYSNRQIMIWDTRYPPATPRNGKFTFNQPEPFGKLTKRFLAGLGMKTKDFKKGQFGDLSRAWYKIDQKKYAVATYDLGKPEITAKLNTFFDEYNPAPAVYPIFHLPQKSPALFKVGSAYSSTTPFYKVLFHNPTTLLDERVTHDGYYVVDTGGNIYLSSQGHVAGVDKYVREHDSINSNNNRQYILAFYAKAPILGDPDIITYENIEIRTVMNEIKVTVKYAPATGMLVQGNPQDFTGLINTLNTDKLTYLGGIRADYQIPQYMKATAAYNSNDLIDPTNKYESIVSTDFDDFYGHPIEVLALMDDGDAFDIVGYGDYKIDYTDIMAKNGDIDPRQQQFLVKTFEYSVTLKKRETILQTDTLVTRVYDIKKAMEKSAKKLDRLSNDTVDTMVKNAVLELIDDEAMDINNYFYRGYIRVDAVTAMTNKDFFFLMNRALTLKYTTVDQNESGWDKVASVVISIVVIVIAVLAGVVIAIFYGPQAGMAAAQMWMALAQGYLIANHPEFSTAIRVIGTANTWTSYIGKSGNVNQFLMYVAEDVGIIDGSEEQRMMFLLAMNGPNIAGAVQDYTEVTVRDYIDEQLIPKLNNVVPGLGTAVVAGVKSAAGAGFDTAEMLGEATEEFMKSAAEESAKEAVREAVNETIKQAIIDSLIKSGVAFIGQYILYRGMQHASSDGKMSIGELLVGGMTATLVVNTTAAGIQRAWSGDNTLWDGITDLKLEDISGGLQRGMTMLSGAMQMAAVANQDTMSNQSSKDQGKPGTNDVDKAYNLYADNTIFDAINILNEKFITGVSGLMMTYTAIRMNEH